MLAPGDFPMPWEDDANPPEAFQSHASKRASLRKDAAARDKIANSLTGNRAWEAPGADLEPETSPSSDGMFGKQRLTALAATVALALVAGAVGGGPYPCRGERFRCLRQSRAGSGHGANRR